MHPSDWHITLVFSFKGCPQTPWAPSGPPPPEHVQGQGVLRGASLVFEASVYQVTNEPLLAGYGPLRLVASLSSRVSMIPFASCHQVTILFWDLVTPTYTLPEKALQLPTPTLTTLASGEGHRG